MALLVAKVLFLIKLYRIISTYELAVWLGFMVICYFITGVLISSKTACEGSNPSTPAMQKKFLTFLQKSIDKCQKISYN